MAGKKISESVDEVDVLLDDMAILSQQMKHGGKLFTEEEMKEEMKSQATKAIEEAGIVEPVVIPESTIDEWINGDDDEESGNQQTQEPQAQDGGDI